VSAKAGLNYIYIQTYIYFYVHRRKALTLPEEESPGHFFIEQLNATNENPKRNIESILIRSRETAGEHF